MKRICTLVYLFTAFGVVAIGSVALAQDASPSQADHLAMCRLVLQTPDAPDDQKLRACKTLGELGGAEDVPVLAALLTDERWSHPARLGLQSIPDPAAAAALRLAVLELQSQPLLLVGVIHGLGVLRDAEAVEPLELLLSQEDTDVMVRCEAARTLGMIGTSDAAMVLLTATKREDVQNSEEMKDAIADGLMRVGDALSEDESHVAIDVYQTILELYPRDAANPPAQAWLAATRKLVLLEKSPGVAIIELLQSGDPATIRMALTLARELPADVYNLRSLVECLDTFAEDPALMAQILGTLGARADRDENGKLVALDAVLHVALNAKSPEVQTAALRAVGAFNDATVIPNLFTMAASGDAAIASAAKDAITAMEGDEVNEAIGEAIGEAITLADPTIRLFAVELVGRRRIVAAAPELAALFTTEDAVLRNATITALGRMATADQLGVLVDALVNPATSAEELELLKAAITEATPRMANSDVAAQSLTNAFDTTTDAALKRYLIDPMGTVGTTAALERLVPLATTANAEDPLADAASRVLGRWNTPDVFGPLLTMAGDSAVAEKIRIRAIRGAYRVIRQMNLTNDEKLAMLTKAIETTWREEDTILAIDTFGRISSLESLNAAVEWLTKEDGRYKEAAAAAIVVAVEKIAEEGTIEMNGTASALQAVIAAGPQDAEVLRRANERLPK